MDGVGEVGMPGSPLVHLLGGTPPFKPNSSGTRPTGMLSCSSVLSFTIRIEFIKVIILKYDAEQI